MWGGRRRAVLCIGDSVMLRAVPFLEGLKRWEVTVDARGCRRVAIRADGCGQTDIPSGVDALVAGTNDRTHAVVVQLGHNGGLLDEHLDAFMTAADATPVIWMTLCYPREWDRNNNDLIRAVPDRWPSARVLDWDAHAAGQRAWFQEDDTHLTIPGAQGMTQLVAGALRAL